MLQRQLREKPRLPGVFFFFLFMQNPLLIPVWLDAVSVCGWAYMGVAHMRVFVSFTSAQIQEAISPIWKRAFVWRLPSAFPYIKGAVTPPPGNHLNLLHGEKKSLAD